MSSIPVGQLPYAGVLDREDLELGQADDVGGYGRAKHYLDFVLALVLLVLTSPLILIAALLVKLMSRGPVIYSQVRVGKEGQLFTIYKMRTMIHNCESGTGARWCVPGDARITPVGQFLRKTHLDELPQLWNILRGEMSLVGPRPERPEFVVKLRAALPAYSDRLTVRPGLTGLAQLQLPPDTDLDSVRRKLAYDLEYVRHYSLWLDLRLIVGTAFKVLAFPVPLTRLLLVLPTLSFGDTSPVESIARALHGPQIEPSFSNM